MPHRKSVHDFSLQRYSDLKEWEFLLLVYGRSGSVVKVRNATGLKEQYSLHPLGWITWSTPATQDSSQHKDEGVVLRGQLAQRKSVYYCQTTHYCVWTVKRSLTKIVIFKNSSATLLQHRMMQYVPSLVEQADFECGFDMWGWVYKRTSFIVCFWHLSTRLFMFSDVSHFPVVNGSQPVWGWQPL